MIKKYFHVGCSGGASGSFISTIMHYVLNEPTKKPTFFKKTLTGEFDATAEPEKKKIFGQIWWNQQLENRYPWRSFLENPFPWEYVAYPSGWLSDVTLYDDLQRTFPNWGELSITIKPHSWKQVLLNHYYKARITDMPLDDILNDSIPICNYHLEHDMWHTSKSYLPEEYQKNIHSIEYSQICDEPDVVLNTISEVVELTISQSIRDAYMEYVENQLEFRKEFHG
jgi:hypothetical protein